MIILATRNAIKADLTVMKNYSDIARKHGVSTSSVSNIARELGLASKRVKADDSDKVKILQLSALTPMENIKRETPKISRSQIRKIIMEAERPIIMKEANSQVLIGMTRHSEVDKAKVKKLVSLGFTSDEIFQQTRIYATTVSKWRAAWMNDALTKSEILAANEAALAAGIAVRKIKA